MGTVQRSTTPNTRGLLTADALISANHSSRNNAYFFSQSLYPALHPLAKTPIMYIPKTALGGGRIIGDLICWTSFQGWSFEIEVYNWKTGILIWVRFHVLFRQLTLTKYHSTSLMPEMCITLSSTSTMCLSSTRQVGYGFTSFSPPQEPQILPISSWTRQ